MFLITIQKIVFIVRIIGNKIELCEKLNNWMVSVDSEIKAWEKNINSKGCATFMLIKYY